MEPVWSLNDDIPSGLSSHYDRGYAGTIEPAQTTSQQHCNRACRKKSKVRLNDQCIPKPTDINIREKLLPIPAPKQHPYFSHMSRFAMFPSFCSPDDPHTGVRAASQPFPQTHIPNNAPDVTVLSKTMGASRRHEILESPMTTRKKAVMWPGERGVLDRTEPLGERKPLYPTPPKAVLPNPKLRDLELSLSERTSNMLKNLERALWVTSYQMHYTGCGPANPLKMDDFKEKMSDLAGINSHSAPLRERSYPLFVPSKPVQGCRRSTSSPTAAGPLKPSLAGTNEEPDLSLNKQRESTEREWYMSDPGIESYTSELEKLGDIGEMSSCKSNPRILPRPPPGAHLLDRGGTVGREGAALSLHNLQRSFSKSEAHRNFNSSVTRAAVNPRDNEVTGKKHNFYGINCYYLHG